MNALPDVWDIIYTIGTRRLRPKTHFLEAVHDGEMHAGSSESKQPPKKTLRSDMTHVTHLPPLYRASLSVIYRAVPA